MEDIDNKTTPQTTSVDAQTAAIDTIDAPTECIEKVVAEMAAMRRAYIARSVCAANRKKKTMEKRRAAEKNAKKMRRAQRKRRK